MSDNIIKTLNNSTKIMIMGELDKIEKLTVVYSHLGDAERVSQLDAARLHLEAILLDIMSSEAA